MTRHGKTEYFPIDGAPGDYFQCTAYTCTLSVQSCQQNWLQSQSREPRHLHCRFCPIGAAHAGASTRGDGALFNVRICCRCHRLSARLIRDEVCPSCYNREREAIIGRNARGGAPTKLARLYQVRLQVAGRQPRVIQRERAATRDEAVVAVLRSDRTARAFAWSAGLLVPVKQLSLFGAL